MAPPSKHPSTRARRNQTSTHATLVPDESIEAPELPEYLQSCAQTTHWWADVWASPMAPEYDESDKHGLVMLAALVYDFWHAIDYKERKELAGEIRLQRNRFGLTPMDRRSLQWQIEQTEDAQRKGAKHAPSTEPVSTNRPPTVDPRAVLHAV